MKYCIIGAGGTGGALAAFLGKANKDVSLIARGENLEALRNGIKLNISGSEELISSVKSYSENEYIEHDESPDVIFICTKAYSLDNILPMVNRISNNNTVIIPILNGINTDKKIREGVEAGVVCEGCIYIVAEKKAPGIIFMNGSLIRVVFGIDGIDHVKLEKIYKDLMKTNISVVLSNKIKSDIMRKFSLVSAMAATGLYFDAQMKVIQNYGTEREFFIELVSEIVSLAEKMGIKYNFSLIEKNLQIIDNVNEDTTTSLQRDVKKGGLNEMESQIVDPIKLGLKYGVEMKNYIKVAQKYNLKY